MGKRNDVVRLDFPEGFWVEYEFNDEGLPMKTVYTTKTKKGAEVAEENRYAQFITTDGILHPFVIDHYRDGKRTYRVNYRDVRFNRSYPDKIFEKPANAKKIKKLKL